MACGMFEVRRLSSTITDDVILVDAEDRVSGIASGKFLFENGNFGLHKKINELVFFLENEIIFFVLC